jgi:SAM-dependent methyltransferase
VDIKQVYKEYAEKGNDSAQQLGWNNLETQDAYMKLMVKLVNDHVPLAGRMVHDAGCGYGDLITYLEQVRGPAIASYVGTDLMGESITEAKKRHGIYHFACVDLLKDPVPDADVTICMGALAFHKCDDAMWLLERLWQQSRLALAFNCWWDLTPEYVGHWNAQKLQKRVQSWLKDKKAVMLSGYEKTERMFLVMKDL